MLLTLSTLIAASSSRGTWIAAAVSVALVVGLLMGVKIPLRYLVRNLTVRWRTTLMTALAFVMVISLLTVMMAFVNGMYHLTQASGQPGNVMVMADGATDESFSNLVAPDMADLENQPGRHHKRHTMTTAAADRSYRHPRACLSPPCQGPMT